MMKTITLPLFLVIQIINVPFCPARASYQNKDTVKYNYGYTIDFDGQGSLHSQTEQRRGPQIQGNYFVSLPNAASQSNVQYVANDLGFQPVVRISTKDANSQVSSHFALGKEAVKALRDLDSKNDQIETQNSEPIADKLLTNEVLVQPQIAQFQAPLLVRSTPTSIVDEKDVPQAAASTYKLVTNQDVLHINDAAEEYFDDVREDQLTGSKFEIFDRQVNDGFAHFKRPIAVQEIIANSLPKTASRSHKVNEPEVIISPTKTKASNSSRQAPTRNINLEIVKDRVKPQYFGERTKPKHIKFSVGKSYSVTVNIRKRPINVTKTVETTPSDFIVTTTKVPESEEIQSTIGSTISEAFLAPIQAGLLLSNNELDLSNTNDFDDNILSDSNQNDQKVPSESGISNTTLPDESMAMQSAVENNESHTVTSEVETYRSQPVIEIVEKTIERNGSTDHRSQTYYHSTTIHLDPESSNVKNTVVEAETTAERIISAESKPSENVDVFLPTIRPHEKPVETMNSQNLKPVNENTSEDLTPNHNNQPFLIKSQSYSFFDNNAHVPPVRPSKVPAMNFPMVNSYRIPGNVIYSPRVRPLSTNFIEYENCFNCISKIVKDDYIGPVPPPNEYSLWNTMSHRHHRQLFPNNAPRMEYGFKPPMRPSVEINDEGLPLAKHNQ